MQAEQFTIHDLGMENVFAFLKSANGCHKLNLTMPKPGNARKPNLLPEIRAGRPGGGEMGAAPLRPRRLEPDKMLALSSSVANTANELSTAGAKH